jgi:hypothetical protein
VAAVSTDALETDQYSTWGRPLADATSALNAKMNLEISRALEAAKASHLSGPPTCQAIAREVRSRVHFGILQPIEIWATHSPLVPRLPATPEEELTFRRVNLNGNHGPFDTGRWIPDSPTIEVAGVRFGADKLSHFFSSGWRYRQKYLAAKKRGLPDQQAQDAAVHWGVLEERTTNGLLTDGVFSRADLEANFAGMRFFQSLCEGPDPMLALDANEWKVRRSFDWREYVTPGWDESYHVSIYSASRWRKVRPRLIEYCGRRNDQDVLARLERYRAIDRPSPADEVVALLVREGTLPDPSRFTLDENCPVVAAGEPPPRAGSPGPKEPPQTVLPATSPPPGGEQALMREISSREADRERRVYSLVSLRYSSLQGLAGSVGWLFTSVESDFDCHTTCDVRGPTVQLQPGVDGGQFSVGYARIFGETGHHERFLVTPYLGLGIRGVLLRTWRASYLGPPGLTFLGAEGQFTITRVAFTLGAMWHAGGADARHEWALSWGIGWGF